MTTSILLIGFCLAGPAWVLAETKQSPMREGASQAERPANAISAEAIERRLKQVKSAANLDETVRKGLIDTYQAALEHLSTAEKHAAKAAEFREKTAAAPKELEQLKATLDEPAPEARPQIPPEMGLAELQDALVQAEKDYEDLQNRLAGLQTESTQRSERRAEIPELEQAALGQLEEIQKQQATNPSGGAATDPAAVAERVLLAARRHALEHELKVYREELRHYEMTGDLLEARHDHALVLADRAEQHLHAWRSAVNDRREREANEETRAAQSAAKHAPPAIRRLLERNAALASHRQELAAKIEIATKEVESLQSQLEVLGDLFKRLTERVKRVGLTESIGLLLRKHRDTVPDIAEHRRFIEERKAEISKLSLQLVDLQEERDALADIDEQARRIVSETRRASKNKKAPAEAEIRKTLETTRGYLDKLIADMNSYVDTLSELDVQESHLIVKAREFSEFTNEYILWIRSAEVPQAADAVPLRDAIGWIVTPRHWLAAAKAIGPDVRTHPLAWLAAVVCVLAFALSQRFWRTMLRNAGRGAAGDQGTSVRAMSVALVATLALAAVWPAALWLAGWRLMHLASRSEYLIALARALEGGAFFLATVSLTRHLCRRLGLGETQFDWPQASLRQVRRSMWWLTAAGLPLVLIVLMTESQSDEAVKNSLGRLAFIALMGLLVTSAHWVWHGPQGLAQGLAARRTDRWWMRLCRLGHLTSVGAPVLLAVVALVGYYYTAVQLAQRLLVTSWLAGGLVVVHSMLLRWLKIVYRELAMQRVREQQAAEASASSGNDHRPEHAEAEPTVRLSDINHQTHKLLELAVCCAFLIGSSAIWVELLPAFAILDSVQLWPHPFAIVDAGAAADLTHYTLSLGELVIASLIALVTAAAARNVPGLVEITILRHLKLDSGARYAVDAMTRYTITTCGLAIAFSQLGVGWQDVQWLVAGMTVGLGFGLQEIFANLVSGLLLLFERPIRIGDTVSIGDVTGKVTRIRIRATTVTDADMRELIVPNREFITGKVINWTLTDTITRMTIKISVPHDSDPDRVKQILLRVAAGHALVLKDPPPEALFDEFAGDNLNFTLRVYMGSRDVYSQLRHELNAAIKAALWHAGIDKDPPQPEGSMLSSAKAA
jgi:potassium efflux system protein